MRLSKRRQEVPGDVIVYPGSASLSFEKALGAFLQAQDAVGHSKVTKYDYKAVLGIF